MPLTFTEHQKPHPSAGIPFEFLRIALAVQVARERGVGAGAADQLVDDVVRDVEEDWDGVWAQGVRGGNGGEVDFQDQVCAGDGEDDPVGFGWGVETVVSVLLGGKWGGNQ